MAAKTRPREDEENEDLRKDEDRAPINQDDERQTRASEKRSDDLERGSAEKMQVNLDGFRYQPLPDPPKKDGWHRLWLSETNKVQSVQNYLRMGYRLVQAEEINALEYDVPTTGTYKGCVRTNEMILAEIPMEQYYRIMEHFHENEPLEDEGRIREQIEEQAAAASQGGSKITVDEGFRELGRRQAKPRTWT